MLEIKNLTKVYKTKGGADVRALDDVSITFDKTGLVFLLGKSGSGKSTLLNLAGGLDEPTSGEVIVMGKSSKDFTGSDFDSYRNTFVGFVFQEYNVLNEFNVEDNIALALELQGKKKDQQRISALLEEVDLLEFAKRKPNTLSGGQKQRIAIARALIKDPQIIMADEPTGALDSATGKQVFETLKNLSKTRLVIVVSHDREFAEIYGDRIVELKDGKIISDVSKVTQAAETVSERVMRIGEDTISVRGGAPDEATLLAIQSFLKESDGELLISRSGTDIASFKRANRISGDGAREHFLATDPEKTPPYSGEPAKFIRSKLPASKAIKIGASGLKLKPLRLIITIFLSFAAFILFGLFSTMMFYNKDSVLSKSFMSSTYEYLSLSKHYEYTRTYYYPQRGETYSYSSSNESYFTPAEAKALSDTYGQVALGWSVGVSPSNITTTGNNDYYQYRIRGVVLLPEGHALREHMIGDSKYPAAANEVCVSSYFVEGLQDVTFRVVDKDGQPTGVEKKIQSAADLIGEYLLVSGQPFKVTGVFDSGVIPSKFDKLKTEKGKYSEVEALEAYLSDGLQLMAFVSDSFYDTYKDSLIYRNTYNIFEYFDYPGYQMQLSYSDTNEYNTWVGGVKVFDPADKTQLETHFLTGNSRALKEKEIIIRAGEMGQLIPWENPYDGAEYDDMRENDYEAWQALRSQWYENHERFSRAVDTIAYHNVREAHEVEGDGYTYTEYVDRPATEAEIAAAWTFALSYLNNPANNASLTANVSIDGMNRGAYTIVGFYDSYENYTGGIYCTKELYDMAGVYSIMTVETKFVDQEDAIYDFILIPFEKSETAFAAMLETLGVEHKNPENDVFYELQNSLYTSVMMVSETISMLSTIFLWVGVGLAVFAALLLANFITMSISNKKKEIGILRAVGARGTDVFKIFFAESGIIVGICTLLALIGTIVLSIVLNGVLKAGMSLDISLFVFGPLSAIMMIGVALVVAVVATFLPVHSAAKKKPVDSIRSL